MLELRHRKQGFGGYGRAIVALAVGAVVDSVAATVELDLAAVEK